MVSAADQMGGANISNLAAMEQTRMLAHTLAQNNDPKFQVHMLYFNLSFSTWLTSSFLVPKSPSFCIDSIHYELAAKWGYKHSWIKGPNALNKAED